MSKSNYPEKLDTSVEIPAVRDNVTEIGSDVLNSLRSAIFNIERTLGINPQGVAGNTLASRLANLIDENGNLKDEALVKAGILSGPISDKDVSKTAAIKEFKLDLDYPTTLLQDEISILDSKIQQFVEAINELNAIVSTHVNQNAINRHLAKAITVEEADIVPSDVGLNSIEAQGLQEFIQALFNSHISYTGTNISEANNSHKADQIFYDNSENSDIILSNSVQGAIDDLADIEGVGLRSSILQLNSNGRIRTGSQIDAFEGNDSGSLIVDLTEITYADYSGASTTEISFSESPSLLLDINKFDILEISESLNEDDNGEYVIASFQTNVDDTLSSVTIFGGPKSSFTSGTLARVKKNTYQVHNRNGLNCSVRPRAGFTNTPSIQAAMPNSATVISSRADFSRLESGVYENLSLEIDGGAAIDIPVYSSDYSIHNVDIAVSNINRYCVQNNLNIFAYKLRTNSCYELAISHNIPNHSADTKVRSLKVVQSGSLDASGILGFEDLVDKEIRGSFGNSFHINGLILNEFGSVKTYTGSTITIGSGTTTLETLELNFLELGIRVGDLCVIDGSSVDSDNGTYTVNAVESDRVTLDYTTSLFSGEADESSLFTFIRCTAPISELNFIDINGSMLLDIFADENLNIHHNRRADIVGSFNSSNFFLVVTDISKNFITEEDQYTLRVKNDGLASIKLSSGGSYGEEVFVGSTGDYIIPFSDGMEFIKVKVFVPNEASPIFVPSSLTIDIIGYSEIPDSVLHLSRCLFSPEFGTVIEDINAGLGETGAVGLIDKRISGTVDDTIISEPFLERYIQGPRNELRSNGIIRGLEILNLSLSSGVATFDVTPGIVVVNGLRVEFLGKEGFTFDYSTGATDSFYIAIDNEGCIKALSEVDKTGGTDYSSAFSPETNLHIAYYDSNLSELYDLRFFIDRIDYKILNQLIVSPEKHFGQFSSLDSAVKYCRVFSKIFKDQSKPKITLAPGTHIVNNEIFIDFDLEIEGAGPESIIQRGPDYLLQFLGPLDNNRPVFQIGTQGVDKDNRGVNNFTYGVKLSNFTYKGVDGSEALGNIKPECFIIFSHDVAEPLNSKSASFHMNNIILSTENYGPGQGNDWREIIAIGAPASASLIEGAEFQNVLITNCFFRSFGTYQNPTASGVVTLTNSYGLGDNPVYSNIVLTNCIRDLTAYDSLAFTPAFIAAPSTNVDTVNVIEVNNVSIE